MIHQLPMQLLACLTGGKNDTQDTIPSNNQNQLYEETKVYLHSQRCPEKGKIPIQKCMCSYNYRMKNQNDSEEKCIGYFYKRNTKNINQNHVKSQNFSNIASLK